MKLSLIPNSWRSALPSEKNVEPQITPQPFDSSVGRAEDCRGLTDILRSLVQIRLEGVHVLDMVLSGKTT